MALLVSIKKFVNNLANNKHTLNVITTITIINFFVYVILGELMGVVLFILLGVLTAYFNKNLVVILGVPLVLVNLLVSYHMFSPRVEGMEGNDGGNNEKSNRKGDNGGSKENKTPKKHPAKNISKQGLPITPLDMSSTGGEGNGEDEMDESFEVGRAKKGAAYNIDHASTIESAYDNLNELVGSDGMKKLTQDTQRLVNQQLKLAESMKQMGPMISNMGPLLQQAEGLLGSFKEQGAGTGLNKLMEMAQKMKGGSGVPTTPASPAP